MGYDLKRVLLRFGYAPRAFHVNMILTLAAQHEDDKPNPDFRRARGNYPYHFSPPRGIARTQ